MNFLQHATTSRADTHFTSETGSEAEKERECVRDIHKSERKRTK